MTNGKIVEQYSGRALDKYKSLCENFFCGQFAPKILDERIQKMPLEEFESFQSEFCKLYNETTRPTIQQIITSIREAHDWVTDDWENDPITNDETYKALVRSYNDAYNQVFHYNFDGLSSVQEKRSQLHAEYEGRSLEQLLQVDIDDTQYKALATCEVLWAGWESDDRAWLIEVDGGRKLVTTNHGEPMFIDRQYLEDKIKEYQRTINETQKLLDMLDE